MRAALFLLLMTVLACGSQDPGSACPPSGPFGLEEGLSPMDRSFISCAGDEFTLHDLCGAGELLIYSYAGWCPSCLHFLERLPELNLDDSQVLILVTEDPAGKPATSEYCLCLLGEVEVHGMVVLDPLNEFRGSPGSGLAIVLDEEFRIVFIDGDGTIDQVKKALEATSR